MTPGPSVDVARTVRDRHAPTYRNLVFEGGGVKGIAYVGALDELEARGITEGIRRVGGASAGSIQALAFALGYRGDAMRELLWGTDFKAFQDGSRWIVPEVMRLGLRFGWFPGRRILRWLRTMIRDRTGNGSMTFAQLRRWAEPKGLPSLYVVVTDLSARDYRVFSHEHTPDDDVALAVRMSLSIPIFFAAVRSKGQVYVDGGVLNNYPVKLFDSRRYVEATCHRTPYYDKQALRRNVPESAPDFPVFNHETLGFNLHAREHAPPEPGRIRWWGDYAQAFVAAVWEAKDRRHIHDDDWKRTIYIDTKGVKFTDFSLSDERKRELVQAGGEGVREYFGWLERDTVANDPWGKPLLA